MIKQRSLYTSAAVKELVAEAPTRDRLTVCNDDSSLVVRLYIRKEEIDGGINIQPLSWKQLDENDDADKQWFIKAVSGAPRVHIIEHYKEGRR